jgi:thiol-disulfide isomerase/thioredoxin
VAILWQYCGNIVAILWQYCGNTKVILGQYCGNTVARQWQDSGKTVANAVTNKRLYLYTTFMKKTGFILFLVILIIIACILTISWYLRGNTELFFSTPSSKTIVFVYSKECAKCKEFQPIWNQFVQNFQDDNRITFKQLNGNMYPDMLRKYNITEYPTVLAIQEYPVPYVVRFKGSIWNNPYTSLLQFYAAFRSSSFTQNAF